MRRFAILAALLVLPAVAPGAPPAMSAVGLLSIGQTRCTATLIEPDLVLTAGHCVIADRGGAVPPRGVNFRTGGYPGHAPAKFRARDVVIHPLYIGAEEDDPSWLPHDAGLVRLAEPVPPEVAAPIEVANTDLDGTPTFLASYRGGRGERARERRCPILRDTPEVVALSCDVRAGESGSPIVVSQGGRLELVGIVSASTRLKRTEMVIAARADRLVKAMEAFMGAPGP